MSYPDAEHDFADADLAAPNKSAEKLATRGVQQPNSAAAQDAWRRSFKWISRWFDPERSIQGVPPSSNLPWLRVINISHRITLYDGRVPLGISHLKG